MALSSNDDGISTLALDSNHNVYAWGYNIYGQLGNGTNIDITTPKLVATNAIDIFAGENFSYILKADNTLWCAGQTSYGDPSSGSIWMNQPNIARNVFTQIDPTIAPMFLCPPKQYGIVCPEINLGKDTALCEGTKLTLTGPPGNSGINYHWQDNSINPNYTVASAGAYWLTITRPGCEASDTIHISYDPLPDINLGKDTSLCKEETLNLIAINPGATYLWQDGSTNSNFTVVMPGNYWVQVTQKGCISSDTVTVIAKDCNCVLNIPNAITPNGDGINDKWVLSNGNCFRQIDVSLYNRYGSLVYEKRNYKNDWNGSYRSSALPDGTYYYVVKTINFDQQVQMLKGNLTILR